MKKAVICTVVVFIFVTFLFTWGFIHLFGSGETIGLATLRNIVIDRALLISIPVALAYLCIHLLIIKLKNIWVLVLMILLVLAALSIILWYFYLFNILIVSILQSPFVD